MSTKIVDTAQDNSDAGAVKLDTSALSKAISAIIAQNTPTETRVNPADYIKNSGEKMVALYSVYEKLRMIGTQLNGKLMSDPIPPALKIENITINFRTVTDDKESDLISVPLTHIASIGDISGLLSTELGAIIVTLQQETESVLDIAKRTKELCEKSRKAWEESNKDKKIQEFTADGTEAATSTTPENAEASAS